MEYTMNNVVFLPGSPALVTELSPSDEPSQRLLNSATQLLTPLIKQHIGPIHVVFSHDKRWYTAHEGSFRAWGAPQVNVAKGHFLGELVARYILQAAGVSAESITECRANIGRIDPLALTVVVLDGSAGLTQRAPLALLDSAESAHQWCSQVLQGHASPMHAHKLIDAGVIEPELWLELAQLAPEEAQLVDSDATLGVGRFIAAWKV